MLYISLIMGLLVGFLVNFWALLCEAKPKVVLVLTVASAILVAIFTYNGNLLHF